MTYTPCEHGNYPMKCPEEICKREQGAFQEGIHAGKEGVRCSFGECKKCGGIPMTDQPETPEWDKEFGEWYERVERITILGNVKDPEKQISVLKGKTKEGFEDFITRVRNVALEEALISMFEMSKSEIDICARENTPVYVKELHVIETYAKSHGIELPAIRSLKK